MKGYQLVKQMDKFEKMLDDFIMYNKDQYEDGVS